MISQGLFRVVSAGRGVFALMLVMMLLSPPDQALADSHVSGESDRLVITIAPNSLPARAGEQDILGVQIISETGVPVLTVERTIVKLFSSDTRVASVESEIEIPVGSSFAIATITTFGVAGSVTFTATGGNIDPGHAELQVVEAPELAVGTTVTVFPMPNRLILGAPTSGRAMVTVIDQLGSPVRLPHDIEINLTSSNEDVVGVPESIVIPAGVAGTIVDIEGGQEGSVQLTAVADGFASAGAGVEVIAASARPTHLVAALVPARWDNTVIGNPILVIHAISEPVVPKDGISPGYLPCGTIFLASSNPELISVPKQVEIPCDLKVGHLEVPLVSTGKTGYAMITVATPGLVSTKTEFNAVNRSADGLVGWVLPPKPAAGDAQSPVVVVQLVDSDGNPVVPQYPIPITIREADRQVDNAVRIPSDRTYTTFPYSLIGDRANAADLWISAADVSSVRLAWSYARMPVESVIQFDDLWRYQSSPTRAVVTVTVNGQAIEGARVSWVVEDGQAEPAFSLTDELGQAWTEVRSSALGQVQVTARVEGDSFGIHEVSDHFDSVDPGQQSSPTPILFGLALGRLAWVVGIGVVLIAIIDLVLAKRPWNWFGHHPRREKPSPQLDNGRVWQHLGGVLNQLSDQQMDAISAEYSEKVNSIVGEGEVESIPGQQRELIACAVSVSVLETSAERQYASGELENACRSAQSALTVASHLNHLRLDAGEKGIDRTRLWFLCAKTLLNAGKFDDALVAAQAAVRTTTQAGSQQLWTRTIDELEQRIRAGSSAA